MAVKPEIEKAWARCPFCSQSDEQILAILREPDRWDALPLEHACGWKRICQVAARHRLQRKEKSLWSELCSTRGNVNNSPSYDWQPAEWLEGLCQHYYEANVPPSLRRKADNATWQPGFNAVVVGGQITGVVQVQSVQPDTPAHTAGLAAGDVIVEANDIPIILPARLDRLLDTVPPGETLTLVVDRAGEKLTLEVNRPSRR